MFKQHASLTDLINLTVSVFSKADKKYSLKTPGAVYNQLAVQLLSTDLETQRKLRMKIEEKNDKVNQLVRLIRL